MISEKFGVIKGLSEQRRLPLLGKIRLGIKKISQKTGKEYPAETDYFIVPGEIKKFYGEYPKELDIMLPVAQRHVIFPQAYRWYGSGKGLKCIGNGENAIRRNDETGSMDEIECPCEKLGKDCNKRAFLMAILPKINMGGVYQISTGSYNSIVDVNSGMDYIEALIGRIQMIPLKLKREKIETHHNGTKQTHYTLKLIFEGNIDFINQLRENTKRVLLQTEKIALPEPKDENPIYDDVEAIPDDIIDEETEQTKKQQKINYLTVEQGLKAKPGEIIDVEGVLDEVLVTERNKEKKYGYVLYDVSGKFSLVLNSDKYLEDASKGTIVEASDIIVLNIGGKKKYKTNNIRVVSF